MSRPRGLEELEQRNSFGWIDNNVKAEYRQLIFAIPNGGSRSKKEVIGKNGKKIIISPEGIRFKRQGVRRGIPDIFTSIPISPYHGLYIEVKSKDGDLSPFQESFIDIASKLNYRCVVAYGYLEVIKAIKDYLPDEYFCIKIRR